MSYNRIGTPTFYIDAMLLARQWGAITSESATYGKFNLNPPKVTELGITASSNKYIYIDFENRYWCNSISHCFVLGHNFKTDNIGISVKTEGDGGSESLFGNDIPAYNGWTKYSRDTSVTNVDYNRFVVTLNNSEGSDKSVKLGDVSAGWSHKMSHSPDLELTQTFSNESIKTQTTLGGHTLTNAGHNHQPNWIRQPWTTGTNVTGTEGRTVFPVGRRSWNLKFSYVSDTGLFPSSHNSATGIFQWTFTSEDVDANGIIDENEGTTHYSIKDNFLDKCYHSTNGFQLPFIFQPNSNVEEYAICRVVNKSMKFEQVANNVYNINLDIVEVW